MYCENCGRKINAKKTECKKCGTAIKLEGSSGYEKPAEEQISTEFPVADISEKKEPKKKWFMPAIIAVACLAVILMVVFVIGGADDKKKPDGTVPGNNGIVVDDGQDDTSEDSDNEQNEDDEPQVTPEPEEEEPEQQRVKNEVVAENLKGSFRNIKFDKVNGEPYASFYDLGEQIIFDEELEDNLWFVAKTKTESLVFEIRNGGDNVVAEKVILTDIFDKTISNSWVRVFAKKNEGKMYFGIECLSKPATTGAFTSKIMIFECLKKDEKVSMELVENLSFGEGNASSVKFNNSEKTGISVPDEGWASFYRNDKSLAENEADSMITIKQRYPGEPENLVPENEGNYKKIKMIIITWA